MADHETNSALQGVATGLENLKATLSGISQGLQNLGAGVQSGGSAAMAGLGRMMPSTAIPTMGPMGLPRHGMYAQEMTFSKSAGMLSGLGTKPTNMSAYEMQGLAARDMGDRIAGFGTMATIYGTGAVASSMAMAPLFNMGASMGGFTGMAAGAGMAGAAMFGIPAAFAKIAEGVQEHAAQTAYLRDSSYRYAYGSGPDIDTRTGTGFNRQAAGRIASGMKQMSFEDMALNSGDLQGILETGTQLNLFRGASDPDAFLKKFKDLTTSVKKMASAFHTSLSEATQMIGELDKIGIQGSAAIASFANKADVYGMASGKTAGEMASVGLMGAEMSRGTGMSMAAGANALQSNVSAFTSLQSKGLLSNEMINQAGGVMALSQGVQGAALNSVNNPFMRVAMAGMVTSEGNLNMNAYGKLAAGGTPMSLVGQTMGALNSPAAYINAFVNADEIKRQMSEQPGGSEVAMLGMITGMSKQLQPYIGGSMKNLAAYTAQTQFGMTSPQWAALESKAMNADTILNDQMQKLDVSGKKQYEDVIWERGNVIGRAWGASKSLGYKTLVNPAIQVYQGVAGEVENLLTTTGKVMARGGMKLMGETLIEREAVTDEQFSAGIEKAASGRMALGGGLLGSTNKFSATEMASFQASPDYDRMLAKNKDNIMNGAFDKVKNLDEAAHKAFQIDYNKADLNQKMFINSVTQFNSNVTEDSNTRNEVIEEQKDRYYKDVNLDAVKSLKKTESQIALGIGAIAGTDAVWAGGRANISGTGYLETEKGMNLFGNMVAAKASGNAKAYQAARQSFQMGKVKDSARGLDLMDKATPEELAKMNQMFKNRSDGKEDVIALEALTKSEEHIQKLIDGGASGAGVDSLQQAFKAGGTLDVKALQKLGATDASVRAGLKTMGKASGEDGRRLFAAGYAGALTSAGAQADAGGGKETSKAMGAVTDSIVKSSKEFKDTADAMKALASQLKPLITKLDEKGYLPNYTDKA